MLRYATEYYYQTKIARLEKRLAKAEAKLKELNAEIPEEDD